MTARLVLHSLVALALLESGYEVDRLRRSGRGSPGMGEGPYGWAYGYVWAAEEGGGA
jgi:hypothetical protein